MYTAGAIVTVTVSLTRKDMKHLFGDDTVKEQTMIDDIKVSGEINNEGSEEQNQSVKKPAWLRQKKGQKKPHKKGTNKKTAPVKNIQAQGQTTQQSNNSTQQTNTPNIKKKEDKIEKESSKEKSDVSDSEADSDRSDDEDSNDKKDMSIDDDDTEWER